MKRYTIVLVIFLFTSALYPCDTFSSTACKEPIYGDRYGGKVSPIDSLLNWWWRTIDGDDILLELFHDQQKINSLHEYYIEQNTLDDDSIVESVHYGSDLRPLGMIEQIVISVVLIFCCICGVYCLGMGFKYGWEYQQNRIDSANCKMFEKNW